MNFSVNFLIENVDKDHLPEIYRSEISAIGRLFSSIFESDVCITVKEVKDDNSRVCNRDCKKSR